jgi:hypothetical protein
MSRWESFWSWWAYRVTIGVFIALLALLAFGVLTDWVRLALKVDAFAFSSAGVYDIRVRQPSLRKKHSKEHQEHLKSDYFRSMGPAVAIVGGLVALCVILLLR